MNPVTGQLFQIPPDPQRNAVVVNFLLLIWKKIQLPTLVVSIKIRHIIWEKVRLPFIRQAPFKTFSPFLFFCLHD